MSRSLLIVVLVSAACAVAEEKEPSTAGPPSWEEFLAATYRENWDGGHFIVDGDIAIKDEKALYEFWESLQQYRLIVNRVGGADDRWNDVAKLELTYCVSDNFGANKAKVVTAMKIATDQKWETMGNVNFTYVPAQDANCTASNPNVRFDVRQVSGQPYLARAFFPSSPRASREVLVDTSSFGNVGWPLENILGHELGHTIGFRHEHTRPEAGTCFEDNNWRPLTPYDSASIMHYPQCNGTSNDLDWTQRDAEGIAALYGAPGGGGGEICDAAGDEDGDGLANCDDPDCASHPSCAGGPDNTETRSGSVARFERDHFGPYPVKPGSLFTVDMTGTGDPDLYVRWGAPPTTFSFHCRPYLDGPDEQCALTVPANATNAYIMIRGFAAGTYELTVDWTSP